MLTVNFCIAVIWSGLVLHFTTVIEPSERPLPGQTVRVSGAETVFVRDSNFNRPHKPEQQQACPDHVLVLLCTLVPLASLVLGMLVRRNFSDVPAFVHGWMLSWSCETLCVSLLKNYVGFFRPSFYEACGFNSTTWQCTNDSADNRRSFPSAHAGSAFATLPFATLYLLTAVAAVPRPCVWKITAHQARLHFRPHRAAGAASTAPRIQNLRIQNLV